MWAWHPVLGIFRALSVPALVILATLPASAQMPEAPALARIDAGASRIEDFGADLRIELAMNKPVPWRVFTLDDPRRLIADFAEVQFDGADLAAMVQSDLVESVTHGRYREGWSRLVLGLSAPMKIETAGLGTGVAENVPALKISLAPTDADGFISNTGAPENVLFNLRAAPETVSTPKVEKDQRPLRIVLDPGHGGVDPSANTSAANESDLILDIAKKLATYLRADGHMVTLTRTTDAFVPLEQRVRIAQDVRADAFLSLHADILADDAAFHTLTGDVADSPARELAERHDLLSQIDQNDPEGRAEFLLLNMAREQTVSRSERLATKLVAGLAKHTGGLQGRPRLQAGFSVLDTPYIPSVLVELGFLSSVRDRAFLADAEWRSNAIRGICEAVRAWAEEGLFEDAASQE